MQKWFRFDRIRFLGGLIQVSNGAWIIAWSIRVAMLLFVVAQAVELHRREDSKLTVVAKWAWTLAFALFLVHVASAFHFEHHWSHAAAYDSTAKETLNKIGVSYGPGVYFNYLFLIVWAIDVFWIWRGTQKMSKSQQVLFYVGRSYLLFIAFNGVVVFKSGWMRACGCIATAILALTALVRFLIRRGFEL